MNRRYCERSLLILGFVLLPGIISPGTGDPEDSRIPAPPLLKMLHAGIGGRPAFAQEGWREEFDSVCAKTDVAMTLSEDELSDRITRCERLKPRIEAEGESTRKVYLRRLQMCQDLYRYVLQSKQQRR